MKSLLKLSLILLPFLAAGEIQAQCSITTDGDPNACPSSNLSARLEFYELPGQPPTGMNPNPARIITSASQLQPNTQYRLYIFHDSFPNENVIACMGNPIGFLPSGFTPFCPTCRDMGSFAYFLITTNPSYQPGDQLTFAIYVGCSQDKSCGSTYCGSPYEIEYVLFGSDPEASFSLP
ncbi:MAG: hypothetical protein HC819_04775 [Cyclobacteriaceae bacterium]|nr:hypothetical protein [Cyclobacteriaceae bacterium]